MNNITDRQKGTVGRKERFKDNRHDVYSERKGLPEPSICPECKAIYEGKRWTWSSAPDGASETLCPACRRIADRYPAGTIDLKGPFLAEHLKEILNLIRNTAALEVRERPLERIMSIEENTEKGQVQITTTGIHVARRIGDALNRAFEGDLNIQYGDGEHTVRIRWER